MLKNENLDLYAQLRTEGVTEEDIKFIRGLIKEDRIDANCVFTPFNIDAQLEERTPGLSGQFHRASEKAGITWGPHFPNEY